MKMSIATRIIFILICFSSQIFAEPPQSDEPRVNFNAITLNSAIELNKKILVNFTAEWCIPCKATQDSIYKNEKVAHLINRHFTAIEANVDSELGNQWIDNYNANMLPTIVFADKTGIEFERITTEIGLDEFLDVLNSVIAKETAPYRAHNHIRQEVLIEKEFEIQLGAFAEERNSKKMLSLLESMGEQKLEIINVQSNTGKILYKVLQKGYKSLEDAMLKVETYSALSIDSFVRKD